MMLRSVHCFLCAWFAVISWACTREPEPSEKPRSPEATHGAASPAVSGTHDEVVVSVQAEQVQSMDLLSSPPITARARPTREVPGRLVSDPSRSFVLRARIAGTIREAPGSAWPRAGARVEAGTVIGRIEPRLTVQEQGDLVARLAAAGADVANVQSELPALRAALERSRALNADGKLISDKDLEGVESKLANATARLAGSRQLVATLESALDVAQRSDATYSLILSFAGEIVEVSARPGEAVEAGAELARVEDFDEMLARVELPVDGSVAPDVGSAEIAWVGVVGATRICERVPPIGRTDSRAPTAYFRVHVANDVERGWLRPGQGLVARLPTGAAERVGVLVPESALVRLAGKVWVYARLDDEHYARRVVDLDVPVQGGWLIDADWARKGDLALVVRGAAHILSFELFGIQSAAASEE